jgi:hypothetical protein
VLTSISREEHRFWHDGAGSAAFAVGYMVLVGVFAAMAARRQMLKPAA